ncbi:MAG: phosphoribosyltransferase [Leptolyngbyaceae cyanobacterium]
MMLGGIMSPASPSQSFDAKVCFTNRLEAGEKLARAIADELQSRPGETAASVIVYALPRGGLEIAEPIARLLHCPLDVVVAKKITRVENPELAIGAVTADGHILWLSPPRSPSLPEAYELALQRAQKRAQVQWQQLAPYRPSVTPLGRIALIVDDGIATGMTMAAAAQALRAKHPAEIWICVPVAPPDMLRYLQSWCDRVVVLATPSPFYSVSRFYQQFPQVEMEEAIECLQRANSGQEAGTSQNLQG